MTKKVAFTKEYEREAVRVAETNGRTQREIADDLGIGLSTLTRWLSRSGDVAMDDPGRREVDEAPLH
jgi:transposase